MDSRFREHSRIIIDGPSRAPARAYFYAIGLTDEDLAKPLVGVANTWIEAMPCNSHLRKLAEKSERRNLCRWRHAARIQHHRHQ